MPFYIHIADPGYPEPPFPGERRFGPYAELEDAISQAVSDAALGMGTALGIYEMDDKEDAVLFTEEAPNVKRPGKPVYTKAQIEGRANTLRKKMQAKVVSELQVTEEAMKAILPTGINWAEMQALAKEFRNEQAKAAKEVAP